FAAASASTNADLALYDPSTGVAYVGDLVTTGHCPLMTDPAVDPKGWLSALERVRSFNPALLVATDGDASKLVQNELTTTRSYIERVISIVAELKKKGLPEAGVASELSLRKLGDSCSTQRDSANVVPLFRRAGADGVIGPPASAAAAPKKKS